MLSKTKVILLTVLSLIFNGCDTQDNTQKNSQQTTTHSRAQTVPSVKLYVVPAIDDNLIYEDTNLSNASDTISVQMAINEYKTLSFVLKSTEDIADVALQFSDLVSGDKKISSGSLDTKIVKTWYQNQDKNDTSNPNPNYYSSMHRVLMPELLLKDESLIKAENNTNMLKTIKGDWVDVGAEIKTPETFAFDPLFKDSSILKSFSLQKNKNKQFFVTIKIPENTTAGDYSGIVNLYDSNRNVLVKKGVRLEVLPFKLVQSKKLEHNIYYDSTYSRTNTKTTYDRSKAQLAGEMKNIFSHLTNPQICQNIHESNSTRLVETEFKEYLRIRKSVGFDLKSPLYVQNGYSLGIDDHRGAGVEQGDITGRDLTTYEQEVLTAKVKNLISITRQVGFTGPVYIYGLDEPTNDELTHQASRWKAIHAGGGKVYFAVGAQKPTEAQATGEALLSHAEEIDLLVLNYDPDSDEESGMNTKALVDEYKRYGHRIGLYGGPQAGQIVPRTYRYEYGIKLLKYGFGVATTFAYQGSTGSIWNDFDSQEGEEIGWNESFVYPAINGAVDTIEWQGWRESATDVMYVATLEEYINKANSLAIDVSETNRSLTKIIDENNDNTDLDVTRNEITTLIMGLINEIKNK